MFTVCGLVIETDFVCRYEMMAEPQRDITPEQAAARLRACGGELYRKKLES